MSKKKKETCKIKFAFGEAEIAKYLILDSQISYYFIFAEFYSSRKGFCA
jgi:hypothetical protein